MKTILTQYDKNFRLTGSSNDISDINFKFNTYLKETLDAEGMPTQREYYMSYNAGTGSFSDLAVRCLFTYDRDTANRIIKSTEDIEWYFEDGTVGFTKQLIKVYE